MGSHMTSPYCIYYNATVVWSHIFHKKVGWQNKNPIHQGNNTGVFLTLALHFRACIDNQSGMGIAMHTILCPELGSITPTLLQTIAVFFLQSAGLVWWLNLTLCWLDGAGAGEVLQPWSSSCNQSPLGKVVTLTKGCERQSSVSVWPYLAQLNIWRVNPYSQQCTSRQYCHMAIF